MANNNQPKVSKAELRNLKKMYLILSLEWDATKNGTIPSREDMEKIIYKDVYWRCSICQTTWKDRISNRLRGDKPCSCKREISNESSPWDALKDLRR